MYPEKINWFKTISLYVRTAALSVKALGAALIVNLNYLVKENYFECFPWLFINGQVLLIQVICACLFRKSMFERTEE